ncbi:MAG: integrase core domain-containing protein [Bacillota bacterium]
MEAFHSILEEDCLRLHEFESFAEAYQVITEFMRYYNEVRLHSSIGYRSPLEYHNDIMSSPYLDGTLHGWASGTE